MTRRWIAIGLFGLALVLRLHNAWVAQPLSGFDAPFHAAYVGIIHFDGRLPLPDESWSTFHPPLYYLACALTWWALPDGLDPHAVLFAMRLINVIAGLAIGLAVYACAGRLWPARPGVALYALALTLFLPMHVGLAAHLGNELFAAGLCAAGVWLLLGWLSRPEGLLRSAALGVVLGLAALAKLNALALLGTVGLLACVRAVGLAGWCGHALRAPAIIGLAALLVSGGYFARNLALYGTPVVMQTERVAQVMKHEGYGPVRPLSAYLSLRADVIRNPATHAPGSRDAVWPMTFASVWFDLYGTTLRVASPWGVRSARVLFGFGIAVTALLVLGVFLVATGRAPVAVPRGAAALFTLAFLSLAAYLGFTYRVATSSALKGTYLSPAVVPFALFAAVGCDTLARRARCLARGMGVFFMAFVLTVTAVFWIGWLAPRRLNPADLYLRVYSDPPTRRVYRYFVRAPRPSAPHRAGPRTPSAP